MTLSPALELIGHDLDSAVRRLIVRRQRRRRTLRLTGAAVTLAAAFCAVAVAGGFAPDLPLDLTKWSILQHGEVDGGRGAFVQAKENATGRDSLFMVEHDAGIDRYAAFLLHEQTVDAARAAGAETQAEPGPLCTPAQLTRAELVALESLRASAPVDAALKDAFAGAPCRGLAYAAEQARLVLAGDQPEGMLMPGAR